MADALLSMDKSALLWINSHHHPVLDAVLLPIAWAGEYAALWVLVGLVLLVWGRPGYRKTAVIMLVTMLAVDRLIGANIGHYFDRTRPYMAIEGIRQAGVHWTNGSFPSGHAHSVWIAAIVLGSRWRMLALPLAVFAVLTCYSRPYFGMHYPGDVIVGSAMGIAAGFAVLYAEKLYARRAKKVSAEHGTTN